MWLGVGIIKVLGHGLGDVEGAREEEGCYKGHGRVGYLSWVDMRVVEEIGGSKQ
jgi:hypothetical protein